MSIPFLALLCVGCVAVGWVGRGWVEVPPGAEQVTLLRYVRDMRRMWRRLRR